MPAGVAWVGFCLLAAGLSGCAADDEGGSAKGLFLWSPDTCDPGHVRFAAMNAPVVPSLQQAPRVIAQLVAEALGDRIVSDASSPREGRTLWTTQAGTIEVATEGTDPPVFDSVRYRPSDRVAPSRERLEDVLEALGVDLAGMHVETTTGEHPIVSVNQVWEGDVISHAYVTAGDDATAIGAGASAGSWGSPQLQVHPFFDLRLPSAEVGRDEAIGIASAFEACRLLREHGSHFVADAPPSAEPSVVNGAIVWRVELPDYRSVPATVFVDAATGAVRLNFVGAVATPTEAA